MSKEVIDTFTIDATPTRQAYALSLLSIIQLAGDTKEGYRSRKWAVEEILKLVGDAAWE